MKFIQSTARFVSSRRDVPGKVQSFFKDIADSARQGWEEGKNPPKKEKTQK